MIVVKRYHDFSAGHRVVGHEGACAHLHGHNYRVTFTVCPMSVDTLDDVGRVLDFSTIKVLLCQWLENNWDHRFLCWDQDSMYDALEFLDPKGVVAVTFNPTAENMASYLLHVIGPRQLEGTGMLLTHVRMEETRKCSAEASING